MFEANSKKIELREGLQFKWSDVPENMKEHIEKTLEWPGNGFDLRTHIVEPKTGQLLKYQPYRRVVDGNDGVYYIRKDENGTERRYNENGKLIGSIAAGQPQRVERKEANVDQKLT